MNYRDDPTEHNGSLIGKIRAYWIEHIHDLEMATHPVGSAEFFKELDEYRFDKLHYLPQLVDFHAYAGQKLLEVGCGIGTDLVRFARAGATVTGIDLAPSAIELARQNFAHNRLEADLRVMDGEALSFEDGSFDVVYGHGVLQYTAHPARMVSEMHRVLRPGGDAIFMVYNKLSWLNALSALTNVSLEHEDAPVLRKYASAEFKRMLSPFSHLRIVPERFPVRTELHQGIKATLFNDVFVTLFNLLPKSVVRPFGWHLVALCKK